MPAGEHGTQIILVNLGGIACLHFLECERRTRFRAKDGGGDSELAEELDFRLAAQSVEEAVDAARKG